METAADKRKHIFAIVAASSGNLVEWFDFYAYAFFAIYFAPAFFPKSDATVQLLNTAGVFAAGFLMRPIGGWFFGRIADRRGRKVSLVVSVTMMCLGSLAIAVLPGYETIGVMAPAILLLARMFQGLSVGGEYGITATYMSEVALGGKRGFYSSFQYVTLIGGQLLASLVAVILQSALSDGDLKSWGWRIPFLIGALASVTAFYLRRALVETAPAKRQDNAKAGSLRELFSKHKIAFVTVVAYTAGGSLAFYTFTTYMQKFLVNSAKMPTSTANYVVTCCLFFYMIMQPVFGALSDRIGRRMNMLLFGALGTFVTYPLLMYMQNIKEPIWAFVIISCALAIVSFYTSVAGIVKAEMFPTEVRALGVGLSYGIANALFGGSAEPVALGLKAIGCESAFYIYVTAMLAVGFLVSLTLPKTPVYLAD